MIPLAVNLNPEKGNPKYEVTITQIKNGYIVSVQQIINQQPPLTQEEAQRKIGLMMKNIQDRVSEGDGVLDKILDEALTDERHKNGDILGVRVFYTLKELVAFLSFVYEEDSPGSKLLPSPKKPKK